MLLDLFSNPLNLLFWVMALMVAVTVHEFSHAWTANYLGDPTARMQGRVSLNPIVHLDVIGTLMLLFFRFGWGKPVQINPNNFKNPKLGSALVALAGPLSNLVTAAALSIPLKFLPISGALIGEFLSIVILLNVILMVFNLLPIPPLDGSKVLYLFLPDNVDTRKLEVYGPILLLGLFFLGGGVLSRIMVPAVSYILLILGVSGLA